MAGSEAQRLSLFWLPGTHFVSSCWQMPCAEPGLNNIRPSPTAAGDSSFYCALASPLSSSLVLLCPIIHFKPPSGVKRSLGGWSPHPEMWLQPEAVTALQAEGTRGLIQPSVSSWPIWSECIMGDLGPSKRPETRGDLLPGSIVPFSPSHPREDREDATL